MKTIKCTYLFIVYGTLTMSFYPELAWSQKIEQAETPPSLESPLLSVPQIIIQAKKVFVLGNREEALKLLLSVPSYKNDLRVQSAIQNISTQFLTLESSKQYYQAVQRVARQEWEPAKNLLEAAVNKEQTHVWVLARLAQVYIELQQYSKAEETLKESLKWNPFFSTTKLLLARLYLKKEDWKESYRWYDSQKSLVLKNPLLFQDFLKVLLALKSTAELKIYQEQALKGNRTWALVWVEMYALHQLSEPKEIKLRQQLKKILSQTHQVIHEMKEIEKQNDYYEWVSLNEAELKTKIEEVLLAQKN